jgi:hypothetical protein
MTFLELSEEFILHIFGGLVAARVFIPKGKKSILLRTSKAFLAPLPYKEHDKEGD